MRLLALSLGMFATPLAAEILPEPSDATPRIQTVRWQVDQTILLTALPGTGLTLLLEPGETISGVSADRAAVDARISSEGGGLLLLPLREGNLGAIEVTTDRRTYRLALRTGRDLMAAYLVRFVPEGMRPEVARTMPPMGALPPRPGTQSGAVFALPGMPKWSYRVKGHAEVRPAQISDDGVRTIISFADGTPLPAIFAIGPAGDEQVVNGYMRGGQFVIDEIWRDLVFRIDTRKATARRNPEPDGRARG